MSKYEAGKTFGRLTLVRKLPSTARNSVWQCVCECGAVRTVLAFCLGNGNTKSCGCLKDEQCGILRRKHGKSRVNGRPNPTYLSWICMQSRCYNIKNKSFADYGGRGIRVCERWAKFENFVADMGERPTGKTINRKDNDGNYEPGNCKWATAVEQARNRRRRRAVCA